MAEIYEIEMKVPLGIRHGTLELETDGEMAKGVLEILGSKAGFTGILKENRIFITGTIKTAVRMIEYEGQGELHDGKLRMQILDKKHSYELTGRLKTEEG